MPEIIIYCYVKAGMRMAVCNDEVAVQISLSTSMTTLLFKFPQQDLRSIPWEKQYFVNIALMSFPNGGPCACLNGFAPQNLKDSTAMSNGKSGIKFIKYLSGSVTIILEGNFPDDLRQYSFGVKVFALKHSDRRSRPLVIGNIRYCLSAKLTAYRSFGLRHTCVSYSG